MWRFPRLLAALVFFLPVNAFGVPGARHDPLPLLAPGIPLTGDIRSVEPYETGAEALLIPARSGLISIDLSSSQFDGNVVMSRLDSHDRRSFVRENDNEGPGTDSRLKVPVEAGAHYLIEVQPAERPFCGTRFTLLATED